LGKITVLVQRKRDLFSKALHMSECRVYSYIKCTDNVVHTKFVIKVFNIDTYLLTYLLTQQPPATDVVDTSLWL